ncbi:hypothetical protein [Deinococcus sonorensis]|uniref:PRTRC system protein F n=1 Tax=Deinococcus sonorensis TaxID=309891 RepID=A0ABV8Y827_9DEIO
MALLSRSVSLAGVPPVVRSIGTTPPLQDQPIFPLLRDWITSGDLPLPPRQADDTPLGYLERTVKALGQQFPDVPCLTVALTPDSGVPSVLRVSVESTDADPVSVWGLRRLLRRDPALATQLLCRLERACWGSFTLCGPLTTWEHSEYSRFNGDASEWWQEALSEAEAELGDASTHRQRVRWLELNRVTPGTLKRDLGLWGQRLNAWPDASLQARVDALPDAARALCAQVLGCIRTFERLTAQLPSGPHDHRYEDPDTFRPHPHALLEVLSPTASRAGVLDPVYELVNEDYQCSGGEFGPHHLYRVRPGQPGDLVGLRVLMQTYVDLHACYAEVKQLLEDAEESATRERR